MASNDELKVQSRDGFAVITLNRPGKGNALTATLLESLTGSLGELAAEGVVRCVVLGGAGGRFSVGMDLSEMASLTGEESQALIGPGGPLRRAIGAVESFPYPVVAMVEGHAAGAACELAVACDLRAGSESSKMGMPPARLGIVYPPEGLERFVRVLGLSTARKLFYTARYYAGPELLTMGMLDFLCPDEGLEAFIEELADHLTSNSPVSMRGHKRILGMLVGPKRLEGEDAVEASRLVSGAMGSSDVVEGIVAFSEKRDPRFAPGADGS